ncbi:MAG: efflux RND transporter periplasmic adaptor subunit [Gammaproteobacteria bacterium]|nr:efflux RND transporter periplasmic adaptor subunit [Gammaproteobacteria bacterium]
MKTRIIWIISFFLFLFAATFIFYGVKSYFIYAFMKNYKEPPVFVSTTTAVSKTWNPFLTAVGSLKASNGVEVNSQVSGQIVSIYFQSGQDVKQGDLLVQLNDEVDQQGLLRDEATLRFNKVDYSRKEILLKENAVARSAVDAAKAAFLQAAAAVASDNVLIAQKKIRAPFAGRIGIRQVNIGQYITSGTAIVSLQALNPLYVDFSLPEQNLPLLRTEQAVTVSVDAYPNQLFQGKISAINSMIDVNTRSIAVRATIPNEKEILYPGLFAKVHVILPQIENVITVPQSAITYSLYGDSIYVVEHKGKEKIAVQKYVTVGDRRDNVVAISKGVTAGEEVITAGQIKLHPNAVITINNSVSLS